MLNIGMLAPGAGEYYVGEVASSAEDYYTGRGEAAGRWVGSLSKELNLVGEVDPDQFRDVLAGRDPRTGDQRVHRGTTRSRLVEVPSDARFDVLQAAASLGVSAQYVRRLLLDGVRYRAAVVEDPAAPVPKRYLLGERARDVSDGSDEVRRGPVPWTVPGSEINRFLRESGQKKFRPGYDLTLRPPKSVSVMWAVGGPDIAAAVRAAHEAAVDEIVTYFERHAVWAREPKTGRRVNSHGVIAAAFDHRTSRAGDPLLHTHVVVANMTRLGGDGGEEWRAVDSTALFEHAKAAGFLYQAHLRRELSTRLGVRFVAPVRGYAEIDGVPDAVVDRFSTRRNEIEEELAATGRSSAKSAQVVTLETRKTKDYSVDADTLFARWRTEAAELGFDHTAAVACTGHEPAAAWSESQRQKLFDHLAGPNGLCERAATFRRSDVVEAIAILSGARATARGIEALTSDFLASDEVLRVANVRGREHGGFTQERWTTVEMATVERRLLGLASTTVTRTASAVTGTMTTVDPEVTEAVILTRPELSAEQAAMVRDVCASERFMLPVEGRPGAGKTYATEAVVAAHVEAGVPIVGCAVSAAAAAELESQAGFARSVMPAATVAKLLWDLDRFDGLAAGSTVVVDEATMIATRDLARLADHVNVAGGRIVLVGDPDQHGAVMAGGVFAHLCSVEGDRLVRLVENRRQGDHVDRLTIDDYRNGLIDDAVGRLDDAHRVIRSATAGESFDAMVADWYVAHRDGSADPMIAGPNSTRRALNERARVLLKAAGELTGEPLWIAGREFLLGDIVVARRNDRSLTCSDSDDFVKNGSVGTVTAVDPRRHEVVVAFDQEGTIRVPHAYLAAGRLEHGYARTTYGVQGHTHDTARYHPTDVSSFEEGYVAVTRGRNGSRLYVVDGTVGADQDEHHSRHLEHHGLDDITDAFRRRRANTMAADATDHLDEVSRLVTTEPLSTLHRRRLEHDHAVSQAPRDCSRQVGEAERAREVLQVRERSFRDHGLRVPADVHQRLTQLDERIDAGREQLAARAQWFDRHRDLLHERDLLAEAERTVESRIRAHPLAVLPRHVVAALGQEPDLQRQRNAWSAAVAAVAIHHARYLPLTSTSGEGMAAVLGPRPTTAEAIGSWKYAVARVEELVATRVPEVEAGPGVEL